jgi:uncharacterized protein (DUF1778 family)
MAKTATIKEDRLQVRLDADAKRTLERAAVYRRKTVSQFVLGTALDEAQRVIRDNETASLSDRDWKRFYDALVDPPKPNAALRRAFQRYRKRTG